MFITRMNRLFARHGRVAFGILTLFIIVPFVLYFSSGVNVTEIFAPKKNASGVSMYGRSIAFDELNHIIDMKLLSISLQWGMPVDFRNSEGRREFLEEALDRQRQLDEASKLGVKVSDNEVASKILSLKMFMTDNKFDEEKFNRHATFYLQPFGLSKQSLDEAVRGDLIIEKLKEQITRSVVVTEDEVKSYYLLNNEEIISKVARFKSSDFVNPEPPDDKDLENYLAVNQKKYQIPAKYKAEVVKFIYEDFDQEAAGKCTDKMLEDYYNANKARFKESVEKPLEQVKEDVRKAVIEQNKSASSQEIYAAYLNKLYGYCPPIKRLPGQPVFDSAANFAHHVKATRALTDTDLEVYYLKNKSRYSEQVPKSFEKAKDEIKLEVVKKEREKLAADKAQRLANEVYKQIEQEGKEGVARAAEIFSKFFKDKGMHVAPTDWVEAQTTNIPGIGDEPELAKAIAKIHPDQPISDTIKGKNAAFVNCLTAIEKERDAKLSEMKDKIIKDYKDEKALTLARDTARDTAARITKALEEKSDFKTAAGDVKFEDVPKFTISSSPGGIPDAKTIANTALKLKAGSLSSSVETPNGALIVYVESRITPTAEKLASQREVQTQSYKSKKEQAAWDNHCAYLKQQSNTDISKELRTDKPKPQDFDPNNMPFDM